MAYCAGCRKYKENLRHLVQATKAFLVGIDEEMKKPSDFERGRRIAKMCNFLNTANDSARHFGLGEML